MAYQLAADEVAITYGQQTYVVNLDLLSNPGQFYFKSSADGSFLQVPLDVAAKVYGAAEGIRLLRHLSGSYNQVPTTWTAALNSIATVLTNQALLTTLGNASGLLLAG